MSETENKFLEYLGNPSVEERDYEKERAQNIKVTGRGQILIPKLGVPIKLPVPDFSNPERKLTCLETDFPIARINELSPFEVNTGKPIYQMSKWWARRNSSAFRSILIGAACESTHESEDAAKFIWDNFYCNHQKGGAFNHLKVLDCFMGGGTTLVEGSRLGMQMTGIDLNPISWFIVKNELALSDHERVLKLFDTIEAVVKPQLQPFFITTCPRGHTGKWIDVVSGDEVTIDPSDLSPYERWRYRWEGPEILDTFWVKHATCPAKDCLRRTPLFSSPVFADKKLSIDYIELTCQKCENVFHAEFSEVTIAPGAEHIILESEIPFTTLSRDFSQLLNNYGKGLVNDTLKGAYALKSNLNSEKGLFCPKCGNFAGEFINRIITGHLTSIAKSKDRKKKDFGIKSKDVNIFLMINPNWIKRVPLFEKNNVLGGWAGASLEENDNWFNSRIENLDLIEIRGETLPEFLTLANGTTVETRKGVIPKNGNFICQACGLESNSSDSVSLTGHTAPLGIFALKCHCPTCNEKGYGYKGKFFKSPDIFDIQNYLKADKEWSYRSNHDLIEYWPQSKILHSFLTHKKENLSKWGHSHWWKMFNSRQLLSLSCLLKTITETDEVSHSLDEREQVLGAFQKYLGVMNMFSFWDHSRDTIAPLFANRGFPPKNTIVECNVFGSNGAKNWSSCQNAVIDGIKWSKNPWDFFIPNNSTVTKKTVKAYPLDPILKNNNIYCSSSTDLSVINDNQFDLIITDPPFGNNIYYADLADFFYVWLRIPLGKWYSNSKEFSLFNPVRSPHSLEAIDNSAEHPDDRKIFEKARYITSKNLKQIRELTNNLDLVTQMKNPLWRPQPSSHFYCQTLTAIWSEVALHLKDGGIMAFTFHHNEDKAWLEILKALFEAGYVLVATYPIREGETKGEHGQFGNRKIEYDIIHVCRKRLTIPTPVSWRKMRNWVKDETTRLMRLLENAHGKTLPEADLRVILRGKSLEFYSRHYGQVLTGDNQSLEVRDALLGINQILDDILDDNSDASRIRPPENAEPISRLFLRIFQDSDTIKSDELHKILRGTSFSIDDFREIGWVNVTGKIISAVSAKERFKWFTESGRNRKVIKNDLDQTFFLIGAALPNSGKKIETELNNHNFQVKKSVDDILKWFADTSTTLEISQAARIAYQLVGRWRATNKNSTVIPGSLFDNLEEKD
jgi:16S rRNA G966 N2-methylase RsmD